MQGCVALRLPPAREANDLSIAGNLQRFALLAPLLLYAVPNPAERGVDMETFVQNIPAAAADVVVIDDEESIREGCRQALETEGYRAVIAENGLDGLEIVTRAHPRVVLLDLRMPGISGVEVLERLPGIDPRIVPIVITGYGTIDAAVHSMRQGAFDFLTKPFDMDQLVGAVERGMKRWDAAEAARPRVEPDRAAPKPARTESDAIMQGLEAVSAFSAVGARESSLTKTLCELESEAVYHARQLGLVQDKQKAVSVLASDLRMVDRVLEKHEFRKSALIQILLDLQAEKRWLPRHVLMWVSRRLNIPAARIYQVAHFYEAFSLTPQGEHTIQVCLGTACHVRRGPELASSIESVLGIKAGETDPTQRFTLKQVHCLGCCALAPVMKVDDKYYGNPSLDDLKSLFAVSVEKEKNS